MTTDALPRRTPPRVNISGREWKLYIIGGLGLAYAASLSAVTTQAEPRSSPTASVDVPIAGQANVVWLDQLPLSQRPSMDLPANWTIASPSGEVPPTSASARVAPAPTTRGPRILTRTS